MQKQNHMSKKNQGIHKSLVLSEKNLTQISRIYFRREYFRREGIF